MTSAAPRPSANRFLALSFLALLALLLAVSALMWLDTVRGDGNGIVAGLHLFRWQEPLAWATLVAGTLAALTARRKWVQNAAVYVVMTVLTVALLEVVCGWLLRKKLATVPKIEGPTHSMQPDPYLGYKPRPDTTLAGLRTKNGVPVYRITFQTDSNHLRITPDQNPQAGRYALFFGCSMTFGEGVQSDETLPYFFSKTDSTYHAYNLAYSGYGPHHALSRLQHDSLRRFVTEPTGVGFYVFIPDHVNRVVQTLTNYGYNRGNAPYYHHDGDSLRYGGLFRDGRKFRNRVYEVMLKSNTLKLFNIGYPFRLSDADYSLTADVLAATAREYRRQFGNDRFYVILYPTTLPVGDFGQKLQARGVNVLDYSKLFDPTAKGYAIPDDEHPTPTANRLLIARLQQDLYRISIGRP